MGGITIAECHGTGTALGDPIEVGALRGIFNASRHTPLLFTSAKTCLGHLEAGAGAAGFIKCCLMLQFFVGIPNNHCRALTLTWMWRASRHISSPRRSTLDRT